MVCLGLVRCHDSYIAVLHFVALHGEAEEDAERYSRHTATSRCGENGVRRPARAPWMAGKPQMLRKTSAREAEARKHARKEPVPPHFMPDNPQHRDKNRQAAYVETLKSIQTTPRHGVSPSSVNQTTVDLHTRNRIHHDRTLCSMQPAAAVHTLTNWFRLRC